MPENDKSEKVNEDDYPYGTKLKYFDMDGIPLRMMSSNNVPEILRGGEWKPYYNVKFLFEAEPISKEEFDKMVANRLTPPADLPNNPQNAQGSE